jgi:hypothetical protein
MPTKVRGDLPKELEKELDHLTEKLVEVKKSSKALEKQEDEIKGRIRAIALAYNLPVTRGSSQYLNLSSIRKALRITRPEKTPKINPEKLRELVGDDLFHEICTVLSVDLDISKWHDLVDQEAVLESMLFDAIIPDDPDAPEALTIAVSSPIDEGMQADQEDLI